MLAPAAADVADWDKMRGMRWALAILVLATALRLPRLEQRPMHADEAIQADRLGTLLESGVFRYDPSDYHGPGLAYASLPLAWLAGERSYAALTERLIRAVPALFGLALIAVSYVIGVRSGRPAGVLAALFTAVSPAMVYYSRYYIPEMLLACFSAAAIWFVIEYSEKPRAGWAVLAGVAAGLMCATKETAVLALAAMAAALLALRRPVRAEHLLGALGVAALAAALVFSSLLTNPAGIADWLRAYVTYVGRAVSDVRHAHPWHYYLQVIFAGGDGLFVVTGMAAFPLVVRRDRPALFMAVYSLVLTVLYSAFRYKTPWCATGFLHGWILLAAIGVARLLERAHRKAVVGAIATVTVALAVQAWRYASPLGSDTRNPLVYAHTTTDVFAIRDRLEDVARRHEAGHAVPIQVVTTENFWPLPWYLRKFSNVQWCRGAPQGTPPAPVVLLSPGMEEAVARMIYDSRPAGERELYLNLFKRPVYLRPGVEVRGYAAMSAAE